MLTGDIRNQIDRIWDAFWSGGISNPLEFIEQMSYLLFIKSLDNRHTLEENKATRLKKPTECRIFQEGKDDHPRHPRPYEDLRWSRFKNVSPQEMFEIVSEHVIALEARDTRRHLGKSQWRCAGDSCAWRGLRREHTRRGLRPMSNNARRKKTRGTPLLIDAMASRRNLYEYMLGKIASTRQNGHLPAPHPAKQTFDRRTATEVALGAQSRVH